MGITGAMMNVPILRFFGYPITKAIGSAAAIGWVISISGTIGFFSTGLYLDVSLPLSIGFVNIPAFLIFIPVVIWTFTIFYSRRKIDSEINFRNFSLNSIRKKIAYLCLFSFFLMILAEDQARSELAGWLVLLVLRYNFNDFCFYRNINNV